MPRSLWNMWLVVKLILGPLWFTPREKNVRVTIEWRSPKDIFEAFVIH